MKFRHYIDFVILACCLVIVFNIHPSNTEEDKTGEGHTMIYVFHDYEGNEYIMNNKLHGASNSWDYLFEDDIPSDLKGDDVASVSIGEMIEKQTSASNDEEADDSDNVKDNQISMNDIMTDLGLDTSNTNQEVDTNQDSDTLVISIGDIIENFEENDDYYAVEEKEGDNEDSSLIIQKVDDFEIKIETGDNSNDNSNDKSEDNNLQTAKAFTFIEEGRVLPGLVSRNDLYFGDSKEVISYNDSNLNDRDNSNNKSGVTIIDDYEDCMTPWGYKIPHGDSVLAYKQKPDTPDICDIERRFCWKGKLSGSYTQQGCSVNNDYTYEQWGDRKPVQKKDDGFNGKNTRQNSDGSVSVKDSEIGGAFVLERPSYTYTTFINDGNGNVRAEKPAVQQTSRTYRDCTSPWGEKVRHGDFIQAFKHANGFSDAPCEAQIRLCSMGKLMGTYTESTCKTRDTSFIDWVNGSPTWSTYSKEKLDLVRKQIKNEEKYYKEARKDAERSTDSSNLDRILYILDQD